MGFIPKDDRGNVILKNVDYLDTWKAMEMCVNKGLVRSIGVSNFNSQQMKRLITHCTIKPVTNQVNIDSKNSNVYQISKALIFARPGRNASLSNPEASDETVQ
jgi:diketogulonate reductase-like aldo/keto reductase